MNWQEFEEKLSSADDVVITPHQLHELNQTQDVATFTRQTHEMVWRQTPEANTFLFRPRKTDEN